MIDKTDPKNQETTEVYTMDTKQNLTTNLTVDYEHEPPYPRDPDRIFFGYVWGGYECCLGRRSEGKGDECDVTWITLEVVLVTSSLHH